MRYPGAVLSAALLLALPACDEKSRPGPVPLKTVILFDVEGLEGGQNLWLDDDGTAIVQVVGHIGGPGPLYEKRYLVRVDKPAVAGAERLVGAHRFLDLGLRLGVGPPGGGHPQIAVVTKAGGRSTSVKRESEEQPNFDPLYAHLLDLTRRLDPAELVSEGAFDWDWHPAGFPSLKDVQGWE